MTFQISDMIAYASRFYGGAPIYVTPFAYTATFDSAIADGATAQKIINIAANGDFICTDLSYVVLGNESGIASTQIALALLQVEDTGSNEKFFNAPVLLDNICNNSWGNQSFAFPRFVSGKTALQVNLTNVSGLYGTTSTYENGIDVVFSGALVRVFQTA